MLGLIFNAIFHSLALTSKARDVLNNNSLSPEVFCFVTSLFCCKNNTVLFMSCFTLNSALKVKCSKIEHFGNFSSWSRFSWVNFNILTLQFNKWLQSVVLPCIKVHYGEIHLQISVLCRQCLITVLHLSLINVEIFTGVWTLLFCSFKGPDNRERCHLQNGNNI